MKETGELFISVHCSIIAFTPSEDIRRSNDLDTYNHRYIFDEIKDYLISLGFKFYLNPDVVENYPSISKDYFIFKKGKYYYTSHIYRNGFEFEFREVADNARGWNWADNELTYLAKKFQEYYKNKIVNKFIEILPNIKIKDNSLCKKYKTAEDKIKYKMVKWWDFPQTDMNFSLSDLDGTPFDPDDRYSCNYDRDKKRLYNGQIKYFRDSKGYLKRGKVYYAKNNSAWVIINKYDLEHVICYNLFDLTPDDLKIKRLRYKWLPPKYFDRFDENHAVNVIRKIFNSNITPKQLCKIFVEYMDSKIIDLYDEKDETQTEYYCTEGKCWSWDKTSCSYYKNNERVFDIVFRYNQYFLIYYKGKRIIELEYERVFNLDEKLLSEFIKKHNRLFKNILSKCKPKENLWSERK